MIHTLARGGLRLHFLFCYLLMGQPLFAQGVNLYRCEANGVPEFRQTPCLDGRERRQQVIEASGGMTPSEPAVRLKRAPQKTTRTSRRSAETSNKKGCWNKRQQLEQVERKLRRGYKASEYQRLHDRQREYEDYLRQFCR